MAARPAGGGGAAPQAENGPDGIEVAIPSAPALARVGGTDRLVYELHVTNLGAAATLERLEVLRPGGPVLAAFDGDALTALLGRPGLALGAQHDPVLGPGLRAVLYLDLPIEHRAPPAQLAHRLTLSRAARDALSEPGSFRVDVRATPVDRALAPTFGPPLRGGPWVAAYDPAMERGHRRVLYAVGGRARVPGRFAIDWFRVDGEGRTGLSRGDADGPGHSAPDRLVEFFGYGAEVLAVADGVVAATRDGVAEPERASAARRVGAADEAGNFVVLDVGRGRYVFYEHLRPGLRVRSGDSVRRGQVIASLGFTGSAMIPHLHLHVADAPSPLGAEGRPYRLLGYTVLGSYPSLAAFGRGERWSPACVPAREAASMPAPNVVVRFDGADAAPGAPSHSAPAARLPN